MVTLAELSRLLSLVEYDRSTSHVDGLDPFRLLLLQGDADGSVVRFLEQALGKLEGMERGGVAFVLAEHYRSQGDVGRLRELFAIDDAHVKALVLNGLWGEPGGNPAMGPAMVALAVEGAGHAAPEVRAEACSVFQN